MSVTANQDQFDAWNGESGTRWTADAGGSATVAQ